MPKLLWHKNNEREIYEKKVPSGSGFLIFTPYLFGERAPINDCYVRGSFINLCINHKR